MLFLYLESCINDQLHLGIGQGYPIIFSRFSFCNRLRTVREEMLSRQPKFHKIVPVSVSAGLTEIGAEPVLPKKASFPDDPKSTEKIIIRKNGIEIEIPCEADEHIITAMLWGLKEC